MPDQKYRKRSQLDDWDNFGAPGKKWTKHCTRIEMSKTLPSERLLDALSSNIDVAFAAAPQRGRQPKAAELFGLYI